jgi:hypothetical protein
MELITELGEQPALESLAWVRDLKQVLEARPKNFARVATEAEKKFVADLLEANLGRPRTVKTPRPKKTRAATPK